MPDSSVERLTADHFHRAASQYNIQVLPQASRSSFTIDGVEAIVETHNAWQWSVRNRGAAVAVGHSCATPQLAFERALAKLREIAGGSGEPAPVDPGPASAGETVREYLERTYTPGNRYPAQGTIRARVGTVPQGSIAPSVPTVDAVRPARWSNAFEIGGPRWA